MFVRGTGSGQEFRRDDMTFYSGIVVKNNDPIKMNRVKIFIPELSNQPYDDWIEKFETFIFKSPGTNSNPKTEKDKERIGDWEDVDLFEELCGTIPWAEPMYPIMGESGNFRYYNNKDEEIQISTISDCNYTEGFQTIDKDSPTIEKGSFSPSYLYENKSTRMGDAFSDPLANYSVKNNPYAFSFNSMKHTNKAKGLFGIPEIGSKVWVFHYNGNLNFPIYFGVRRDYRELTVINDTDNEEKISNQYPIDFEN